MRGAEIELVPIATAGDANQQGPIGEIGTSGVFTKELQCALLDRRIDLAVHSLKDLPTEKVEGLLLAAVPERESTADVLVSRENRRFTDLPRGARIGTGSLRRRSQLLHARPDLVMLDVRGNVETRLRKLHEGQYDALVLAEAGLKRLGLAAEISEILPRSLMLPAIGQGALGVETRADDETTRCNCCRARSSSRRTLRSSPNARYWHRCEAAAWRRSALWGALSRTAGFTFRRQCSAATARGAFPPRQC